MTTTNTTTAAATSDDKKKNIIRIIINEEYKQLVPPLSEQEFQTLLKQPIKDYGQWVHIITNQHGVLLDGYHRYRACKELGIEPRIMIREFDNPLQ